MMVGRWWQDVEAVLKVQLGLTSLVMTAVLYPVAAWALPEAITIQGVAGVVTPLTCYFCIISGLWGGCIIGFITEYYTSHSYQPVRPRAVAESKGDSIQLPVCALRRLSLVFSRNTR
jgi:inorganic pyrophosphatase